MSKANKKRTQYFCSCAQNHLYIKRPEPFKERRQPTGPQQACAKSFFRCLLAAAVPAHFVSVFTCMFFFVPIQSNIFQIKAQKITKTHNQAGRSIRFNDFSMIALYFRIFFLPCLRMQFLLKFIYFCQA
jgi:hypothetical protein